MDSALPYDTLPYGDPIPSSTLPYDDPPAEPGLASRIGSKLYLYSEATTAKRKLSDGVEEDEAEEVMDIDGEVRPNAIFLQGSPISHLPTARMFAYCKHYSTRPIGLEWIDDTSCVLVFESTSLARAAFDSLHKADGEAKPIPVTVWPPEERISATLGTNQEMKERLTMRWATRFDVKKRGAKASSGFYKKYGDHAGKETYEESRERSNKRQKRDPTLDDESKRKALDEELDKFLAEDEAEPPSRMRSDYIASDGRTLLVNTSDVVHPRDLASRLSAPRRRERGHGGRGGRREPNNRTKPRPRKTQEELDEELEAFLNQKD